MTGGVTQLPRYRGGAGDKAPPLICDCDLIPFPHFIDQCLELLLREIHVLPPRDLLPACNTGVSRSNSSDTVGPAVFGLNPGDSET